MRRLVAAAAAGVLMVSGAVSATAGSGSAVPEPFGPRPVPLHAFDSIDSGGRYEPGSAVVGDKLVFAADGGEEGNEVWVTNGTPGGTRMLKDIATGQQSNADPAQFVHFKGRVWFTAYSADVGEEWWVTDGTPGGTRLFADLTPGNPGTSPAYPVVVGDRMFFEGWTGNATSTELMVTDGTVAGTRLAADTFPGPEPGFASQITRFGNGVVYRARTADGVSKPYFSDGTPAGTRQLDSEPPFFDVDPTEITVVGGRIFFRGSTEATGRELWSSRGMTGDARPVRDIVPGEGSSFPSELTAAGSRLYFVAHQDPTGLEVWTSDGTPGGTVLLRDVEPPTGEGVRDLRAVGSRLYFAADDGAHGRELWTSNGTTGGTRLVRDLEPGTASSGPSPLAGIDGRLLFDARTGHGREPWTTDGTAAGTRLLADIGPGPVDSWPWTIGVVGKTLVCGVEVGGADALWAFTVPRSRTVALPASSYARRDAARRRIFVPVRVSSTSPLAGVVTLTRNGRVVGRGRVVAGRARVRVVVPLRPGRHVLRASYGGSVRAQRSSDAFVLRVRR